MRSQITGGDFDGLQARVDGFKPSMKGASTLQFASDLRMDERPKKQKTLAFTREH